jgi:amino acid transporter
VPIISILVAMVLGFLFLLPFPSWQSLITLITGATVLSYGLQPLSLTALRRQAPGLARPYLLPAAEIVAPIAFIIANLIIYWSGWDTDWKLMIAVLGGFVVLLLTWVLSPPERRPSLDWQAAYWIVPYLGGLTLISFIGAKDFGGRGLIGFGPDAAVVAIFSLVIYFLALRLRLADDDANRYITELSAEAEAEEELLAEAVPRP